MPTGPARSGRPDDRLRMVEGACGVEADLTAEALSTALRAVPLSRFAGLDKSSNA